MFETSHVEAAIRLAEREQVQGRQIAGGIVQEHVFGAGVGGVDPARRRASVPFIDGGIELDAGVSAGPGRVGDAAPQITGLQSLGGLAVGTPDQRPITVIFNRIQELVCNADGIVGILAGDREIGIPVPIGIVGLEVDRIQTLTRGLDRPLNAAFRDKDRSCRLDRGAQIAVHLRIKPGLIVSSPGAGLQNGIEMLGGELGSSNQRCHFLFLDDFPIHESLDVRMVGINYNHLCRAAGGAA